MKNSALSLLTFNLCLSLLILGGHSTHAEDPPVRRATPAQPPRAIPVDPDEEKTPSGKGPEWLQEARKRLEEDSSAPAPVATEEEDAPAQSPATPKAQSPDQIQLQYADLLYSQEIYDLATAEYQKYLKDYGEKPAADRAWFRLAECFLKTDQNPKALRAYQKLLDDYPVSKLRAPAAYRLATLLFAQKEYARAIPHYREATQKSKRPEVALSAKYYLARSYLLNGEPQNAAPHLRSISADEEAPPLYRDASLLALARIAQDNGKQKEALGHYEKLAAASKNARIRLEATIQAGVLAAELGDTEASNQFLQKGIQLDPTHPWSATAAFGLMSNAFQNGDYAQVIGIYGRLRHRFPEEMRPQVLQMVARSYQKREKYRLALDVYTLLATNYPDSPEGQEAPYKQLVCLYNLNHPSLLAELDRYIAESALQDVENSNIDMAHLMKAETLFRNRRYRDAVSAYSQIRLPSLPEALHPSVLYKLAWALQETEQYPEAIEEYTTFIEDFPENPNVPPALMQRALTRKAQDDAQGAIADLELLIAQHPQHELAELAYQQKAAILAKQGEIDGMIAAYGDLLGAFPDSEAAAEAHYWMGWGHFEKKRYQEAIALLQKARHLGKKDYGRKATIRILLSAYYLENAPLLSEEVDALATHDSNEKIPPQVLTWLGAHYFERDDWAAAEKYLLLAAEQGAELPPEAWRLLGQSQLEEKKYREAVTSLDRFITRATDPTSKAQGLLAKGRSHLGLGEIEAAQSAAEESLTLQRQGRINAQGQILLGDILYSQDKFTDAAKAYEKVGILYEDPEITPLALQKAAEAYEKSGDRQNADKLRQELRERYPDFFKTAIDLHNQSSLENLLS